MILIHSHFTLVSSFNSICCISKILYFFHLFYFFRIKMKLLRASKTVKKGVPWLPGGAGGFEPQGGHTGDDAKGGTRGDHIVEVRTFFYI